MVHPANVAAIIRYVEQLEQSGSTPWREVAGRRGSIPAAILRGARSKAEMTQTRLSELTGIPQRHISEMEQGKRPIGKETAGKLAAALNVDYKIFL
jgi:DNA-binding XRE family transcriptional regulator